LKTPFQKTHLSIFGKQALKINFFSHSAQNLTDFSKNLSHSAFFAFFRKKVATTFSAQL